MRQDRNYYFISGLPRSGSTMFCNLLAQNPRFRSDGITSELINLLQSTCETWDKIDARQNWKNTEGKQRVLRAIFHAYYADSDHPVIFDKSRGWPQQLEMLEMILQKKAKLICLVRDMRAVMCSWEKLRRKNFDSVAEIPIELAQTIESRVAFWSG